MTLLKLRLGAAAMLLWLAVATGANAQAPSSPTDPGDRAVTAQDRRAIVDSICALMERRYVFPDKAKATAKLLQDNLKKGKYENFGVMALLTEQLTQDLQALTRDGHLSVFPANQAPPGADSSLSDAEGRKQRFAAAKDVNFGFRKVEILPGNIGLLQLDNFWWADIAAPTAIASMNFLANCRALIIDLRQNGGGQPSMIQLIISYFYDHPVHLNSFYDRNTDSISQFWTQEQVIGPRMAETPVYVLTSQHSFSAAEEFAYNLKVLKRGKIIGETSGGGAHPNDFVHYPNLGITMSVAWGRAINPITGTNWEGVGVIPDVAVSADKALAVAQMLVLDSLIGVEPDSLTRLQMSWWQSTLAYDTLHYELDPEKLADYAGQYGPRKIWAEKGELWYQRDENPKAKLIPLEADLFQHSMNEYFRVKFNRDATGQITELVGLYAQGHQDKNPRDPSPGG